MIEKWKQLLTQWIEKSNQWLSKYSDRYEEWAATKWMKNLRISSSVVWNLFLILSIVVVSGFVFVGAVGAGYFASLVKEEPLRSKEEMRADIFNYEETTELYFANNVYLGKMRTDLERRETNLSEVSPFVLKAVLATEDEYFYEHNGIVPKAVIRGLLQDVTNSHSQTGGSTLTQQLIKNQILTNEISYERKAKELLLAMRLEKFMNKDEILEAYLNIIPYGRNASGRNIAGIETASEGIFNLKAKDLSLPQAAYIAGIPQAPFAYTPFTKTGQLKDEKGLKAGIDRMKIVLFRMKETGDITEAEYNEAINYDIAKDFRQPEIRPEEQYPWLTFEIEDRAKTIMADILAKKDGIDPERLKNESKLKEKYKILADRELRSQGYRVYSTIDKDLYDATEKVKNDFKYYGQTLKKTVIDPETKQEVQIDVPVQVGSILIENNTGKILSFIGGRDFQLEAINHATQSKRSNGSTMKPLLVYAPAIEYGVIGAGSPVVDVKFKIPGWSPKNYTESDERGIISAREALASSQNLPVARLYDQIINRRPAEFLKQNGFSNLTPEDYTNLSTSIGALRDGVTVEENTNAYATFANGGQFVDAYMIEKIEDLNGNVIYEHQSEPVQVFSPQTSYIITDMLRDVLSSGTGTLAKRSLKFNADFAAKTGTSQMYRDVWLVGYNPNISLGVWLGYDKNDTLFQYNGKYKEPSTRINLLWATIMNAMYDTNPSLVAPSTKFEAPQGVVSQAFCGISGLAPSEACSKAGLVRSDLFNANVFLPSKPDDSLISASYVTINQKKYRAMDATPREFVVAGGAGVNKEFIDRMLGRLGGDANKLFSRYSGFAQNVVAGAEFKADGSAPETVQASMEGRIVKFTKSASKDVVGYRVYKSVNGSPVKLATILEASSYQFSIPGPGDYFVVAVDITGLESAHSNIVKFEEGKIEPNPPPGIDPPLPPPTEAEGTTE